MHLVHHAVALLDNFDHAIVLRIDQHDVVAAHHVAVRAQPGAAETTSAGRSQT